MKTVSDKVVRHSLV